MLKDKGSQVQVQQWAALVETVSEAVFRPHRIFDRPLFHLRLQTGILLLNKKTFLTAAKNWEAAGTPSLTLSPREQ